MRVKCIPLAISAGLALAGLQAGFFSRTGADAGTRRSSRIGRGRSHNIYDITPDSQNNVHFTDFANSTSDGSMMTDHISRLDPTNGQITEYLLSRPTNIRRVLVDNSTTPVTFRVGSNHGASIIKLEPMD
jgi:hypothetical protein